MSYYFTAFFAAFGLAACSPPSGGLAGGAKAPAGDAPKPGNASAERDAGSASGDDASDQPVQVIGTYLTCEVNERAISAATIGCTAVRKGTRRKVDLAKSAKSATWSYSLPPGTKGTVDVAPQPPSER